jgi:hypothetical protein
MKKIAIAFILLSTNAFSQEELPKFSNDTLYTASGYTITLNQELKIGTGSMPDGDFKFIRKNSASMFNYTSNTGYQGLANQANSFPRSEAGHTYKVKRIEKRGTKKHGYNYYVVLNSGLIKYEMDVENAITFGELIVPVEFRPKKESVVVEVKQQTSVADELKKLKALLDDGTLTQEEYDAQKKKLLEK